MPGASGVLTPPRRTEAESCTASTIASGVDRGGLDLDTDCAIAAPVVPSASATNVDAIACRTIMIGSLRFPILVHANREPQGADHDVATRDRVDVRGACAGHNRRRDGAVRIQVETAAIHPACDGRGGAALRLGPARRGEH